VDLARSPGDALPWWTRLARFNGLTAVASIAGNLGLMVLFVEAARLPLLPANAMAVAVMSAANFIGADRLVFPAVAAVPCSLRARGPSSAAAGAGARGAAELTAERSAAWHQQVDGHRRRASIARCQTPRPLPGLDFDGPANAAAEARAALTAWLR
jgi:hypothetical protein